MQFIDLEAQQQLIREEIEKRIRNVLNHGKYIMGPEVFELEEKLADYTGVKHCISCSSGTDALLMALMAEGVKPGDAIFTTPFTFIATAEVIVLLGATPVFVDIDPVTYNIDPQKLVKCIEQFQKGVLPNGKSSEGLIAKGIIPVNLFGLPADYDPINRIASDNALFVLEDAAQSFGAEYKRKRSCNLTGIAATSFFPAKPLGCYGDGGAIFTDDKGLAEKLTSIRVHGKGTNKYDNIRLGINGRLDTIQAAILLAKLEGFPRELERKRVIASHYTKMLQNAVQIPSVPDNCRSAWAQFCIRSVNRSPIITELKASSIPAAVYYPKPLHLQSAFTDLAYVKGNFPVSEKVADEIFALPMHAYLDDKDLEMICNVIIETLKNFPA